MRGRVAALLTAAATLALLTPGRVAAQPFPVLSRTSGFLNVPVAESIPRGGGLLGVEGRLDWTPGSRWSLGPAQLNLAAGLGANLEAGFLLRQGGLPGDVQPTSVLVRGSLKFQLLEVHDWLPALALDASIDRVNWTTQGSLRAIVTTGALGPFRLSAAAGLTVEDLQLLRLGPTGGLAAIFQDGSGYEVVAEAWATPRGLTLGGELRRVVSPSVALTLRASWIPREAFARAAFGVVIFSQPPASKVPPPAVAVTPEEEKPALPEVIVFTDDRPHFRLKIKTARLQTEPSERHLHYPGLSSGPARPPGAAVAPRRALASFSAVDLRLCAARLLQSKSPFEVFVEVTITAQGKVKTLQLLNELPDGRSLEACLLEKSARWQFPEAAELYKLKLTIESLGTGGTR